MGASIGGDDSVAWSVEHGDRWNVVTEEPGTIYQKERLGASDTINLIAGSGLCEGRDPVTTEGLYFQVTIKVPSGAAGQEFLTDLENAVQIAKANGGAPVSFPLRIVTGDHNQITVDWPFPRVPPRAP